MTGGAKPKFGDLAVRAVIAVVFAAIGMGAIWRGGGWGLAFIMVAGAVMAWEWRSIAAREGDRVLAGFQTIAVAGAAFLVFHVEYRAAAAFLILVAVVGVAADLARGRSPWWSLIGVLYLGGALGFFVYLLGDPRAGLQVVVWLVLIVVATDVGAYFSGFLAGRNSGRV